MDPAARLSSGLAALGYASPANLSRKLLQFGELLLTANQDTNLVGASDPAELIAAHFLDSLAPVARRNLAAPVIDIGSGAGLPGVPVALAFPSAQILMLEPRARRQAFLEGAIRELKLTNAAVRKLTAETAGRSELRERAGTVVVRAVAPPLAALELALPLLRLGGDLVLYIGRQAKPTEQQIAVAQILGGELVEASRVDVPYLDSARHAWWFKKTKATPADYPRRAKVPPKQRL